LGAEIARGIRKGDALAAGILSTKLRLVFLHSSSSKLRPIPGGRTEQER
jgi:hypothetical protein